MKKLIFCLVILVLSIIQVSCSVGETSTMSTRGAAGRMMVAPLSSPVDRKDFAIMLAQSPDIYEDPVVIEPSEEPEVIETPEESRFNDEVPLAYDEQESLQDACEKYDVPYALVLGLIEKESNFRNITGDNGSSSGYMQIQQKWHWDRMERLGVTDLMDPEGNFLVGVDFMSELYNRYDDWAVALTVYNMGHYPGYITNYAYDVLNNYENWQVVVGADD